MTPPLFQHRANLWDVKEENRAACAFRLSGLMLEWEAERVFSSALARIEPARSLGDDRGLDRLRQAAVSGPRRRMSAAGWLLVGWAALLALGGFWVLS